MKYFHFKPSLFKTHTRIRNVKVYFCRTNNGVEGYIESASGIVWDKYGRFVKGRVPYLTVRNCYGALCNYISTTNPENFQPMKANFGILQPLSTKVKSKKERNNLLSLRSINTLKKLC